MYSSRCMPGSLEKEGLIWQWGRAVRSTTLLSDSCHRGARGLWCIVYRVNLGRLPMFALDPAHAPWRQLWYGGERCSFEGCCPVDWASIAQEHGVNTFGWESRLCACVGNRVLCTIWHRPFSLTNGGAWEIGVCVQFQCALLRSTLFGERWGTAGKA